GEESKMCAALYPKLHIHIVKVHLHRAFGNRELRGDLPVPEAAPHQPNRVHLPPRQAQGYFSLAFICRIIKRLVQGEWIDPMAACAYLGETVKDLAWLFLYEPIYAEPEGFERIGTPDVSCHQDDPRGIAL